MVLLIVIELKEITYALGNFGMMGISLLRRDIIKAFKIMRKSAEFIFTVLLFRIMHGCMFECRVCDTGSEIILKSQDNRD